MSYSDDAVKAKLSALNETQESIVTVAQWVMFHRRHADRTAQLWLEKLRDTNAHKRLNLIYLANEVCQQSKARRKEDFLNAFSPIIADATATAFRGAPSDVQQKLRRVVEVWRQRNIFEGPIQDAVEARVEEVDRSRASGKKPLLGGSLFASSSGSIPSELQSLSQAQLAVSKSTVAASAAVAAANAEYDKMNDPSAQVPTPPVHAARLSQLLKSLASAENSVSAIIKSRQSLIQELEKLLDTNKAALAKEQSQVSELSARKAETEAKKREVEDAIMRGLSVENSPAAQGNGDPAGEQYTHNPTEEGLAAPMVEALTPPPVESLTPVGSPKVQPQGTSDNLNSHGYASVESTSGPTPPLPEVLCSGESTQQGRLMSDSPPNGSVHKRRKVSYDNEQYPGFEGGDAMAELDADVAELLRQESNKY
ncbi:hypothetical protein VTO42DRAFT_409 [Malbranchea cinnamomea]